MAARPGGAARAFVSLFPRTPRSELQVREATFELRAKALDATGEGSDGQVIAAVEWCAAQPDVDIISMSLGTAVASDGQDAMSAAVNCAADPNWSPVCAPGAGSPKIVVVAAGNAGPGPETVGTPGAAERAITVGALANPGGDGQGVYLAAFSSRGSALITSMIQLA